MRNLPTIAGVILLSTLLALSLWFAYDSWSAFGGPPIPGFGYLAFIGGAFFSLVIGCGLIALMFYSHSHGYDDIGDQSHHQSDHHD